MTTPVVAVLPKWCAMPSVKDSIFSGGTRTCFLDEAGRAAGNRDVVVEVMIPVEIFSSALGFDRSGFATSLATSRSSGADNSPAPVGTEG